MRGIGCTSIHAMGIDYSSQTPGTSSACNIPKLPGPSSMSDKTKWLLERPNQEWVIHHLRLEFKEEIFRPRDKHTCRIGQSTRQSRIYIVQNHITILQQRRDDIHETRIHKRCRQGKTQRQCHNQRRGPMLSNNQQWRRGREGRQSTGKRTIGDVANI